MKRLSTSVKLFSLIALSATSISPNSYAQYGNLSGNLMMNTNFFQRDLGIGAANNPLYDNLLSGGEGWLSLRYSGMNNFDAFLRVDAMHNSNLKNPTQPLTGFGIGAWSLSKKFNNFQVTGGYIYDQIGSGLLFRAYEDRGLLIDNALVGLSMKYDFNNIYVKAFTGQQKNVFDRFAPIIKGVNVEGGFSIGEDTYIAPGIGFINRTLDINSIDEALSRINSLPLENRFSPKYNMYAVSVYNNLSYKNISWFFEGAYKTQEAINDINGNIINASGTSVFTTLNYAAPGFAITFTGKRTENFSMRTSPSQTLLNGMMNWQPIIAQIRPQRLISRYMPASQDLSELGGSVNAFYSPNQNYDFNLSYTHINTLEDLKLYRELFASAHIRSIKNATLDVGIQYLEYNQEFYQVKPGAGILKAITPFAEFVYRLDTKKSFKVQAQYMNTEQDYGSWMFGSVEYAVAPNWTFALSDMFNFKPTAGRDKEHYYSAFVGYTKNANRFTLAYVKQVEGINCTGGVCRYEPAFNGLRFGVTSTF